MNIYLIQQSKIFLVRSYFVLLKKKLSTENLVKDYSNMLIKAIKSVDKKIIGIKTLEYWQRLKVYKMFLVQYLEKRKINLLSQKIELSIRIQLKILPYWLISKV